MKTKKKKRIALGLILSLMFLISTVSIAAEYICRNSGYVYTEHFSPQEGADCYCGSVSQGNNISCKIDVFYSGSCTERGCRSENCCTPIPN